VVLPQAFRVVLPFFRSGNQFISLIKDSSTGGKAISVRELTYAAVRINDISWRSSKSIL